LYQKQGSGSIRLNHFADCPTTETQVEKTLKGFCSGNIAKQTRPFWALVGSWQTRLSPTFRGCLAYKIDFLNSCFMRGWAGVLVPILKPITIKKNEILVQWLYECNCNCQA